MTEMILNRDIEEDRIIRYLNIIKEEGIRLSRMVSELLNIARIESGSESPRLSPVDISFLIRSVLESFEVWIAGKEAEVRYEESGNLIVTGRRREVETGPD
jgi:signal transduction histidine kinase